MKKILLLMSVAILMALCSAPSFVHADTTVLGSALIGSNNDKQIVSIFMEEPSSVVIVRVGVTSGLFYGYTANNGRTPIYYTLNGNTYQLNPNGCYSIYIPTLTSTYTWTNGSSHNTEKSWNESLPPELQPQVSVSEQRWRDFYDWFYDKFGYYPREGSLIDLIRLLAIGDWTDDEEVEITFPTLTPAPPTPTPIPVQTIFVPDGNGNTTIIYQYTDPTTGVITQSPYNPNIDINVNCNHDGGSGDNIFTNEPTDPTALTSSMLWADGFGVEITDNPLTAANDSQKSLAEAAAEYSDSVNVVSNSFNILPFKWLILVGLLGGILIIAGLMRTFLGG